jgi:hypothetical protein
MVDCGSDQGRSDFETAGVARLRRGFQKSENADMDRKMPFPDGQLTTEHTKYTEKRLVLTVAIALRALELSGEAAGLPYYRHCRPAASPDLFGLG